MSVRLTRCSGVHGCESIVFVTVALDGNVWRNGGRAEKNIESVLV